VSVPDGSPGIVVTGCGAGFSIMQAQSADALAGILDGHRDLETGGSTEVLESLSMPGM
jgi:hypothetical protein